MSDKTIIQQILDKTNGGLDIILSLYPEAANCVNNRKHFKLRDEKTASATLSLIKNGRYYVTDFGGDFKGGAIDLFMYKEGYRTKSEAIKALIQRYGIEPGSPAQLECKPQMSSRPATETEQEGEYFLDYDETPSEETLRQVFAKEIMNHVFHVYKDKWKEHLLSVMRDYNFFVLKSYSDVKEGKYRTFAATSEYPIFGIRGNDFVKILTPKAKKEFRFRSYGKKSEPDYMWGYARLIKKFNDGMSRWEEDNQTEAPEDSTGKKKKVKPFQLDSVIICCGERDSLNVATLNKNIIWGNSEGHILSKDKFIQLRKMCKEIYYLGDLDTTGRRQMHKTQLKHLEIKGIELPVELMQKKDWRYNPCKDVRDYFEHYLPKDFERLIEEAMPYKFWDEEAQVNREGEFKKYIYTVNNVYIYNFIQKCGFYKHKSKAAKSGYEFIRIDQNVVTIIDPSEIKDFINSFLKRRRGKEISLRNTFLKSKQLNEDSLSNLAYIELDFKYFAKDQQFMFFLNEVWEVTPQEIKTYKPERITKMVWSDKVVQHRVKLLPPPFTIKKVNRTDGTETLGIEIHNMDCLFMRYLISASRMYWKEEEERLLESEIYNTKEKKDEYRKVNKFNIAGPLLSEAEKEEQVLHLINKFFTLGYILARYKEPSKAWAPFIMDHKLSEEGISNGGSGKSIYADAPSHFMSRVEVNGKNRNLHEDKHAWEEVTERTEYVRIDDLDRYAEITPFFNFITAYLPVNPKHASRFVINYPDSPKLVFTTNYGVRNNDASTERRLLYVAFSDYYHPELPGKYSEERKPTHDFGKELFTEFNDAEWNLFINTMAHCLQWYFKLNFKCQPPMNNVIKRNLQETMGSAFHDWADLYFGPKSGRLDEFVSRGEAFQDFLKNSNNKGFSPQRFKTCLEAWCQYNNYVFNPTDLHNSGKRITRKAHKRLPDGSMSSQKESVEMFYVKTKATIDPRHMNDEDEIPSTPEEMKVNPDDIKVKDEDFNFD